MRVHYPVSLPLLAYMLLLVSLLAMAALAHRVCAQILLGCLVAGVPVLCVAGNSAISFCVARKLNLRRLEAERAERADRRFSEILSSPQLPLIA